MATPYRTDAGNNQEDAVLDWSERPTTSYIPVFPRGRDPAYVPVPVAGNTDRNSALGVPETAVADVASEGSKTLCIYCKDGFLAGSQYRNHLIVCPAVERKEYTLAFQSGDVKDDAYRGYTTVLAQVVDCSTVKAFGVSKALADKYPFSSPFPERRRLGAFNRAIQADRVVPGTIGVHKSKAHVHDPLVANLFAQFYPGMPFEANVTSQNLVSQLSRGSRNESRRDFYGTSGRDDHFLEGLQSDTLDNRTRWFQECLEKLLGFTRSAHIQKVVFLYKTECSFSPEDWERVYVPAIKAFFDKVSRINVVVLNIDQEDRE
ncbi:uncharacterized protein [Palaemon carinicauda]|uniref:uncharacterized protein n=1 Tax=Palaemon carinicauda TaxID=392227 RepID=UPI0035B5D063